MTKVASKKYVPKLANMHQVCEVNYARLLKLIPDCDTEALEYQVKISHALRYSIKILECSRYTSTLEMSQNSHASHPFMQPIVIVRLYHDAKMAEVLSAQNIGALQPSYRYPNIKMYQKNEKEMVNLFLAEWLQFCLAQNSKTTSSQA